MRAPPPKSCAGAPAHPGTPAAQSHLGGAIGGVLAAALQFHKRWLGRWCTGKSSEGFMDAATGKSSAQAEAERQPILHRDAEAGGGAAAEEQSVHREVLTV